LIFLHGELRPNEVAADEEAMAKHFYQARQLCQRSLLLVFAQLLLKINLEKSATSFCQQEAALIQNVLQKMPITEQPLKLEKKKWSAWLKFGTTKLNLIHLAKKYWWKPSFFLLGETSPKGSKYKYEQEGVFCLDELAVPILCLEEFQNMNLSDNQDTEGFLESPKFWNFFVDLAKFENNKNFKPEITGDNWVKDPYWSNFGNFL
jgi:hypothetical protein